MRALGRAASEHGRLNAGFALVDGGDISADSVDALGFDQTHGAAAEAAAGHSGTVDAASAADGVGQFDQ